MNDGLLLSSPIIKRGCSWGIAVVAGTGSVVVGVKVHGSKVEQLVRRGGQGHLLGDHGSGA
jgi:N-acetylglucosamine kinase-like BadF-type ATPase